MSRPPDERVPLGMYRLHRCAELRVALVRKEGLRWRIEWRVWRLRGGQFVPTPFVIGIPACDLEAFSTVMAIATRRAQKELAMRGRWRPASPRRSTTAEAR